MNETSIGPVHALSRAFSILNIVGASKTPLSLTEIVKLSGLSKTTVHRLLKSLVANRYITVDRHSEYSLGQQIVCLGAKALQTSVASVGYEAARAVYDSTKQTVCICSLSGFDVVYLLKIAPRVTIKQDVGSTRPAHCTALGKCQLACLPENQLDALLATYGLPRLTPNTICDQERFKQELREIREKGFAVNRQEANTEVAGVAAPIFNFAGDCIAAISIATIVALADKDILEYADQVVEAARIISSRMGHIVPDPQWL